MRKITVFASIVGVLLMGIVLSFKPMGYKVGDIAKDFRLKNIDDKLVSLADFKDAKGFIVVFTCNHCPYAKMYEDRIMALDKEFASKGFPVIAINPNDPSVVPDDSFENMKKRAKEKGYTFPYLFDETQEIAKTYGAEKTPHVYLLNKEKEGLRVSYIGAIDDNAQDANAAKQFYVKDAVNALLSGKKIEKTSSKAIGCSIKWKNS
ncbi:MAG: thioredoxin family protein [Flammeovirgaceae bacterium]